MLKLNAYLGRQSKIHIFLLMTTALTEDYLRVHVDMLTYKQYNLG